MKTGDKVWAMWKGTPRKFVIDACPDGRTYYTLLYIPDDGETAPLTASGKLHFAIETVFSTRNALVEYYREISNAKPGDTVWWFDNGPQTIRHERVYKVNGRKVETIGHNFYLGRTGFLTREALCEHYRKIFE